MNKSALLIIVSLLFVSCHSQTPFDSETWKKSRQDLGNHSRRRMADALLYRRILEHKTRSEVEQLLGVDSEFSENSEDELWYSVDEFYGFGIDPVFVRNLKVSFSKGIVDKAELVDHSSMKLTDKVLFYFRKD